jgi:Trypsin-like peptidase domain
MQPTTRRRFVAAVAAACAAPPALALMAGAAPDSPLTRLDPNRIDSPFACVASLMGGGCYSGVCIAPGFVLTAAHVAAKAKDLFVYLNLGADLSHRFAIRRVFTPPAPSRPDPMRPVADLALLELDGSLPAGLTLPPLARGPARIGQRIELAAYGASGQGDRGVSLACNGALKRVGANRIDRILGSADAPTTPLLYFFRFDAASGVRRDGLRSLGNGVEAGLASGDSGSPAFVRENGRLALLGINSFVMRQGNSTAPLNGFGTIGGGQLLAAYRPWLLTVLGAGAWAGLG